MCMFLSPEKLNHVLTWTAYFKLTKELVLKLKTQTSCYSHAQGCGVTVCDTCSKVKCVVFD